MRPMPKKLLIHTVIHATGGKKDSWGKEEHREETALRYVRMEPSCRIVRDKNNAEIQLAATLFYDCKNSRPSGMKFSEDDVIMFNGQKHRVQVIEPLYDGKRLHHYELGLIRYA